jgi:hypothetical protein
MLRLFRRLPVRPTRQAARPAPRRLGLEALETRDCPAAPVITNLTIFQGMGTNVIVTGSVQDEVPSGVTVHLGGVVSGNIQVMDMGDFSRMLPAASVGTVTAVATDCQGLASAPRTATVTNTAPGFSSLGVEQLPNKRIRVFGFTADERREAVTVRVGGVASGSVISGADGYFTAEFPVSGLGDVTVRGVDQWGLESAEQTRTLTNSAPTISDFSVTYSPYGGWLASGYVADSECNVGMPVTIKDQLGNVAAIKETNLDGWFSCPIRLPADTYGSVTARTNDWWGAASNEAWQIVNS